MTTAKLLLLSVVTLILTGCESSQILSARLQKEGAHQIADQHGLVIRAVNRAVRIVRAGVVTDANGTAVALMLRNVSPRPLATVPIGLRVLGSGHRTVFRNDAPGLQSSLVSIPALPGRGELTWVDDQVTPAASARSVRAEVGAGGAGAPLRLPEIFTGPPHVTNDPISGLEATGEVTNRSPLAQQKLVVYVTAWRGVSLVSAGRAVIALLGAKAHATYHVYLIGNPRGAALSVDAPPTVLR